MMRKISIHIKLVYLIFILFISNNVKSQPNTFKIDSLNNLINTTTIDSVKINSFYILAQEYYNNNQLTKAEFYCNEMLQLSQKNHFALFVADAYNLLGMTNKQKGFYELSLENYNKALDIYKKLQSKNGEVVVLNNISGIYNLQSNLDKAIEFQLKSLKIKEQIGDKKSISVSLNNIGNYYSNHGYYEKALEYYNQSLKICKEIGDKSGIANSLNNIGINYYWQNNYEKATEFYNLALFIFQELNDKNKLSGIYNNLAIIYGFMKDYEKSLDYYNKSLEIEKNNQNLFGLAEVLNNIAVVYSEKGDNKKAIEYFSMAYDSLIIIKDIYTASKILCSIGIEYYNIKNFSNSIKFILESNKLALENGYKDILKNNYNDMASIYSEMKDYKNAFKYMSLFSFYKDSVLNEEKQKQIIELQTRFETEKKEKEIVLLNKDKILKETEIQRQTEEIKQQQVLNYSILFGLGIFLFFSIIILRMYIQKRRANVLLKLQKKQINDSINYAKLIQEAMLPELSTKSKAPSLKSQDSNSKPQDIESEKVRQEESENLLPVTLSLSHTFESFVLFRPKDIVSGDFYWTAKIDNILIVAVADCTGHGVPGAFMSMLGISFLNEIVRKNEVKQTNQVLNLLRKSVIDALNQTGKNEEQKDGMDISLITIKTQVQSSKSQAPNSNFQDTSEENDGHLNTSTGSVHRNRTIEQRTSNIKHQTSNVFEAQWSGANIPLWLVRNNDNKKMPPFEKVESLEELKPDKMPIAIYDKMDSFTNHDIQLYSGDCIYLMSDGYQDQCGGQKGKKYLSKNLKQLLLDNFQKPMSQQKEILETTLENWIGDSEQIDDITILGIRI